MASFNTRRKQTPKGLSVYRVSASIQFSAILNSFLAHAFLLSLAKIGPPDQQFHRSILVKRLENENNDKKWGEAHTIFIMTHAYTNEKSHFEIKEPYIYFPHNATFYKIKFPCSSKEKH